MIEINLLPPKDVLTQQEKKIRKYVLIFLAIFSTIVIAAQIFLSVANTTLSIQAASQKNRYDQLKKLFASQADTIFTLRTINNKVEGIKQAKKMQVDMGKSLGDLIALFGTNAKINSFSIGTDGNVNVSAVCSDVVSFGNVMDNLNTPATQKMFNQISVTGIKEDKTGIGYALTLKYNFNK